MHEEVPVNEEELLTAIRDQARVEAPVTTDAEWEVYTRGNRIGFRVVNRAALPDQEFTVEADVLAVARIQEALVVDAVARQFVAALQNGFPRREAGEDSPSVFVSLP